MKKNNELNFIARHYKKGMFAVAPALRRVKGIKTSWWTRSRIAAACVAAAILTATAAIYVHNGYLSQPQNTEQVIKHYSMPPAEIVRTIDFENAPLSEVVQKISEVYGVEVINIPETPDQYTLSLHYEGSARDLVDTINDILDTEMIILE